MVDSNSDDHTIFQLTSICNGGSEICMIPYQTKSDEDLIKEIERTKKQINRHRTRLKQMEAEVARRALIELKQAR